MADADFGSMLSSAGFNTKDATAAMSGSPSTTLRYMPDDTAEGLDSKYRESLQAREQRLQEWERSLPSHTATDYRMSPEYRTSQENIAGTTAMLRNDEEQAAELVRSNREVASKLGKEPLPVAVGDSEAGMFTSNAAYVKRTDGSERVSVNQMDLEKYGPDSNEVKGSLAHEYGHKDWAQKGMEGSRAQEELYSDSTVAKTCDPNIVNAYKKMLENDYAGVPADQPSRDGIHPSLNDRKVQLDTTYEQSCKVAPMATPAGEAAPSGPSPTGP